ncbi:MAG: stage III sporulation protein AD [Firmicutes bacterium]|nr:stage III sporulation protein AD [Bacillota bacterium]
MDIMVIIGVAIITTFLVLMVKPHKPEIAILLGLGGGILVVLLFVEQLQGIIQSITQIAGATGIGGDGQGGANMFSALLRIIGIGYLTEFAANICEDAGNTAMSKKVTLAGKVLILVLALPIINNLIDVIISVLP